MPDRYRVLFVCTGNTCRSVIAAHVLRRELADAGLVGEVASAGLRVQAEGEAADPRAQDVLRRGGYQSEHRTRQFQPAMLTGFDLVVGLDSMHVWVLRHAAADPETAARIRLLGSFDTAAAGGWDVPDPVTGGPEDYERVLALVQSAMPGVIATVRAGLATS
ncbi:MAG TPA: low molecular weight protein-tyrosine-phosphatase [Streptosporangiaceae bacterium]|nr:low molecular weight protein-tyrosine-phosphatase [Streptosporangiaceae bacterium]